MSKPEDIPQDVWNSTTETFDQMLGCSGYPGARDDSIAVLARAIMAAKKEEREACAQVAVEIAAGRMRQSHEAKAANKRAEFRDFESMSMSATDVAFAIRKRGEA